MSRLLLSSAVVLLVGLASCHSTTNVTPDGPTTSNGVIVDSLDNGTVIYTDSVDASSIGNDDGMNKDSVYNNQTTTDSVKVHNHNAPDQEYIDSLKNAKLKDKKPND